VCPHDAGEGESTEGDRTQVVSCFALDFSVSFDLGFDPADHGKVREHRFARVMAVRCHPIDLMADRLPTSFDPPSGQVHYLLVSNATLSGGSLNNCSTSAYTAGQFFFNDMQ
jgi:hypothetical protein